MSKGRWRQQVNDSNDILVIKMLKQLDLTKDSFRVYDVLEGLGDLFDGNFLARLVVFRRSALKQLGRVHTQEVHIPHQNTYTTTPYAPWPIGLINLYLLSIWKEVPETTKECVPGRICSIGAAVAIVDADAAPGAEATAAEAEDEDGVCLLFFTGD